MHLQHDKAVQRGPDIMRHVLRLQRKRIPHGRLSTRLALNWGLSRQAQRNGARQAALLQRRDLLVLSLVGQKMLRVSQL